MKLFSRLRKNKSDYEKMNRRNRSERNADFVYLSDFAASRQNVRGYYEEGTAREPASLLLVAESGEWTRRKVRDGDEARRLCGKMEIECLSVAAAGYPPQMRQWNREHPNSVRRS
ncbi:hypothetical protein [Arcanobacterium sp. S3PF19]|uniref:hypothetical protein n=1 Tax=Arcanobacterium sp. S3PF19 TaxID=1219585 RepID=UPI00068F594E|nr:hypothetical protein [Arcanobacterium sp. S3PF19]